MPNPDRPAITRRSEMLLTGTDHNVIRSLRVNGLHTVRPGSYVDEADWRQAPGADRHRLLLYATIPRLDPGAVVSHVSAAVLHDLPLLSAQPSIAQITRNRVSGGFRRHLLHSHVGPPAVAEIVTVGGLQVTAPGRTVIDCARSPASGDGVCIADQALQRRLVTPTELEELIAGVGQRRGAARARQVVARADGRSESPGETLSRLRLYAAGLHAPVLQWEVFHAGRFVARTDFAWPEHRAVGEFDGAVKYGSLAPTDEALRAVLLREKSREQALRDLGREVVRWTWAELAEPAALADRVRSAFRRAARGPA